MTDAERKLFVDTLRKYEDDLGQDLPGYNDYSDKSLDQVCFKSKTSTTQNTVTKLW